MYIECYQAISAKLAVPLLTCKRSLVRVQVRPPICSLVHATVSRVFQHSYPLRVGSSRANPRANRLGGQPTTRGGVPPRKGGIARQPLRPEVVTYVAGTFCYLCLRAGAGEGPNGRESETAVSPEDVRHQKAKQLGLPLDTNLQCGSSQVAYDA